MSFNGSNNDLATSKPSYARVSDECPSVLNPVTKTLDEKDLCKSLR